MQISQATIRYMGGIPKAALQLVIIGKDPFPSDATGIPFCKPTWEQQMAWNCSGLYVLLSLGLDLVSIQEIHPTPASLFESLRAEGIVFLNASYAYLGKKKITQSRHIQQLKAAHELNKNIIQSASAVIYCGEASKIKWIDPIERTGSHYVVHPDVRNKNRRITFSRWHKWWSPNALVDSLNIKFSFTGLDVRC